MRIMTSSEIYANIRATDKSEYVRINKDEYEKEKNSILKFESEVSDLCKELSKIQNNISNSISKISMAIGCSRQIEVSSTKYDWSDTITKMSNKKTKLEKMLEDLKNINQNLTVKFIKTYGHNDYTPGTPKTYGHNDYTPGTPKKYGHNDYTPGVSIDSNGMYQGRKAYCKVKNGVNNYYSIDEDGRLLWWNSRDGFWAHVNKE